MSSISSHPDGSIKLRLQKLHIVKKEAERFVDRSKADR
jgi:hypothetical protein